MTCDTGHSLATKIASLICCTELLIVEVALHIIVSAISLNEIIQNFGYNFNSYY
jgi:hypothetical protein